MSKVPTSASSSTSRYGNQYNQQQPQPQPNNQSRQRFTIKSAPPKGFELIEDKLNDFKTKMREAESESTEFKRKAELLWPILRLTHQRTRYVYAMFLKKLISEDVLTYCEQLALIDSALLNFWKKPGYEYLCCLQCAQKNSQFGGTCICRVPANQLAHMEPFECKACGCRGCSGVKKQPKPTQQQQPQQQQQQPNNDTNSETKTVPSTSTTTTTTTTTPSEKE